MAELTPTIADFFTIESTESLKAVADPLRLSIMKALKTPKTVKEVAADLQMPPTKLYYHVNLLEKQNLIRVVATQVVSGIIEKTYLITARNYRLSDTLLADEGGDEAVDAVLAAIFDITRAEVKQSLQNNLLKLTDGTAVHQGILWRAGLRLTVEQFEQMQQKLEDLLQEMDDLSSQNESDEAARYGLMAAFYPTYPTDTNA